MIQLQRHIEILLLENECVIVPDFGGFMTHQVPARYDSRDRSFLPPTRTLGFNPQLRMNDSVLAQSYVEAYDISYPEALRRIESEVEVLKKQLSEQGSYVMENLGTLSVNSEGNYEFTPCESGILSPELYGLSNFTFKQLKDEAIAEPVVEKEADSIAQEVSLESSLLEFTDNGEEHDEEKTIVIKMSWVRNAVAVAAAVVAFFFFATPVNNSNLTTQTMSQMQHHLLFKLIPQDTNIVPAEPIAEDVQVANEAAGTAEKSQGTTAEASETSHKAEAPAVAPTPQTKKTTYCIVVASQVKMSNAELFVAQLQGQGYKDAQVYVNRKVVRVICGEYETMAEAYAQLNKMNHKPEFAEAWVYKKTVEV